jgi:hypothetical protein
MVTLHDTTSCLRVLTVGFALLSLLYPRPAFSSKVNTSRHLTRTGGPESDRPHGAGTPRTVPGMVLSSARSQAEPFEPPELVDDALIPPHGYGSDSGRGLVIKSARGIP